MASKEKDPAARRAQKAARRAARKRSDARPQKTSRLRYLRDLEPPGVFYREWERPNGTDDEVMTKVADAFGPDSDEAVTMRAMLYYRDFYGPSIPLSAARQLDEIMVNTSLGAELAQDMGSTPDETRDSLHSLHAQGLLLIADDGSLWLTAPPGAPHSAANGQWMFVEKKADAPELTGWLAAD